jgi:uncharacterized protein YecE (DUF72 family)
MIEQNPPNFFSGLSGLALPIPKYKFPLEYQKTSHLTYYATMFNSLEVNRSFYKIPLQRTVTKWASSVSKDFKFTFKLFKDITHQKNLKFDSFHLEQFMEAVSHTDPKKGCILVQFPPSLKNENLQQLDNLLRSIKIIDRENTWKVAVEFRNKGWYNDDVYNVLDTHHASLVIHDIPASATPLIAFLSNVIYIRFHGPTGNYRGTYTDAFLNEYAEYIKTWLDEGKTVYVYFNNTIGDAFHNLRTLKRFVL